MASLLKSDKAKENVSVKPDESSDETLLVSLASTHSIVTVDITYLYHPLRYSKSFSI